MIVGAQIKGLTKLKKFLAVENKRQKKALQTAIKVEAFNQLRELRDQIKKGIPGGRPYSKQLSEIARRTKTGRYKKQQIPLFRLARLLRYDVSYVAGEINVSFGFVSGGRSKMSSSWKKLILKHEEGADVLYTGSRTDLAERMAAIGGRLKKKGDPDARFFFLRKTTALRIRIPKRSMVDPFWRTNAAKAKINIVKNYQRKLAGHRI